MRVLGIGFTSRPTRRKPLTCARCVLRDGRRLEVEEILAWPSCAGFEDALRLPGPWVAGIGFPFGQSRAFVTNMGWPPSWSGYVLHAASLGRDGFRAALGRYRAGLRGGRQGAPP
jgi:hypothetical protein